MLSDENVLTHFPLFHIYVSVNWVSIWSLIRCQAIIWTIAGLLSIEPLGTNFSEILIKILFIHENASENVFCKMAAILSRER